MVGSERIGAYANMTGVFLPQRIIGKLVFDIEVGVGAGTKKET